GDVEDVDQCLHERVELPQRDRWIERHRDQPAPERSEETWDEVLALGDNECDAVAALEARCRVVRGPALRCQAKIVKGNEEILAGPLCPEEGETAQMLAFTGVQGRDHTDHGRPVLNGGGRRRQGKFNVRVRAGAGGRRNGCSSLTRTTPATNPPTCAHTAMPPVSTGMPSEPMPSSNR